MEGTKDSGHGLVFEAAMASDVPAVWLSSLPSVCLVCVRLSCPIFCGPARMAADPLREQDDPQSTASELLRMLSSFQ
jgi:hypothetical protein